MDIVNDMSKKHYTVDHNGKTTGTPCIRVCSTNPEHGLCSGCYRTLDEIEEWSEFTDEQKEKIMIAIEIRKELLCDETGTS